MARFAMLSLLYLTYFALTYFALTYFALTYFAWLIAPSCLPVLKTHKDLRLYIPSPASPASPASHKL
jgi:hypothetical protein